MQAMQVAVALCLVMSSCIRDSQVTQSRDEDVHTSGVQVDQDTSLVGVLKRLNVVPDSLLSRADSFYAFAATLHDQNERQSVVVLLHREQDWRTIHPPIPVDEFTPAAKWLRVESEAVDAVVLTTNYFDARGTDVYGGDQRAFTKLFSDNPGSCDASEVRDIDGDNRLEVISYENAVEDCSSFCWSEVSDATPLKKLAWVTVTPLSIAGERTDDPGKRYPDFHRERANEYRAVAAWYDRTVKLLVAMTSGLQLRYSSHGLLKPANLLGRRFYDAFHESRSASRNLRRAF